MTNLVTTVDRPPVHATRARVLAFSASLAAYLVGAVLGAAGALTTSAGQIGADPSRRSIWYLCAHNLGVLVWLAGGLVTAGVITLGVMALNGMLLGWVVVKQVEAGHAHLVTTGILPHLPLELAAYVLSGGATLLTAVQVLRRFRRQPSGGAGPDWRGWFVVQAICVCLLFLAAIVEAQVAHV